MQHIKTYHSIQIDTPKNPIIIEGPVSSETIAQFKLHEKLTSFRQPEQQQKALIKIADFPEGRVIIARDGDIIVGYCTYLYPDTLESWSKGNMKDLIELGAIEVSPAYRGFSVAKGLLDVSMMDDAMEDYIIFTTEYYWHWDLKGTGLNIWEYRDMMKRMGTYGGFEARATNDPEICSHPANCLMVRIGKRVKPESIEKFDKLRFSHNYQY